ncbi:MAG: hypothetical protein FJ146_02785 [Deltaproteobacteria bacterium]|nr:hypothetical protein [Deltaproteobacteria bacterium]
MNKMALAMRLPVGVTQIHSGRSLDNLQATDLLIVLGLSTAEALKLPKVEPGKVQWTTDVTSPILLTHHPRELLAEPALKRQSWTQLQVAMAYLKL